MHGIELRLNKFVLLAGICAIFAPVLAAIFYQSTFSYHWLIVPFLGAALVFTLCSICVLAIGAGRLFGARGTFAFALLAATVSAVFSLIYAGAFISNWAWGDTISFGLARSFARNSSQVFSFLPIPEDQQVTVLYWTAFAVAAGVVLIVLLSFPVWRRVIAHIMNGGGARTRTTAIGLLLLWILAGAACTTVLATNKQILHGEPLVSFLELVPASRLMGPDNARLIAAIEDQEVRSTYKPRAPFKRRHVILIVADSLRADRMGVYGYKRQTTPFLSGLHKSGLLHRVNLALSTCSETFCGLASTFASRPYHQIAMENFKLHDLLRDVGYGINFFLSGNHRNWGYLRAFYGSGVDNFNDFQTMQAKNLSDDRFLLDALERMKASSKSPQFFYFFLMSSHVSGLRLPEFNVYQPAFFDRMRLLTFWNEMAGLRRVGDSLVSSQLTERELEIVANRYDNGVLQTDFMISKIFGILNAKGYLEDSIVVIIGDHGDSLGERGHVGHTRYLYQADIRIPLLIYENILAQYKNSEFATQIDIAPTIIDRLGLDIPRGWRGLPLTRPSQNRTTLHQTRRGNAPCFAVVRKADKEILKYIKCGLGQSAKEELFDIVSDPNEQTNLIGRVTPTVLQQMRTELNNNFAVVTNQCKRLECRD